MRWPSRVPALMRNSMVSGRVHRAVAVAGGAGVLHPAGATAARALDIELHAAAHLGNLAGAMALRTLLRAAG